MKKVNQQLRLLCIHVTFWPMQTFVVFVSG